MSDREIILPEYDYKVHNDHCHQCGRPMNHIVTSHTYTRFRMSDLEPPVHISNIHAYQCPNCLGVWYNSVTAKTIEDMLSDIVLD